MERAGKKIRPKSIWPRLCNTSKNNIRAKKSPLRPVFEQLLALGKSLGPDVKACPCKTMVPLLSQSCLRSDQAHHHTRIDFGLCFTSYRGKLPKRLIDIGGLAKKDRITHRIEVSTLDQIDDELKRWFRAAYDPDG
jgi:hypothetical protein